MKDIPMAIISIFNGEVHLDCTVNEDASDDGSLHLEMYPMSGWTEPQSNSRLRSESDFWRVWDEWNAKMPGGIVILDSFAREKWLAMARGLERATPSDIKSLPSGKYIVFNELMYGDGKCKRELWSRARVLYCIDYLMHSLNDEEAMVPWLRNGIPDGTLDQDMDITNAQARPYLDYAGNQDEFNEYVALMVRVLLSEVYPKVNILNSNEYERNVLT